MRYLILCVLAVLLSVGCGSSTESTPPPNNGTGSGTDNGAGTDNQGTDNQGSGEQVRTAAVAADNALFSRVEGTDAKNDCATDSDCKPSGCSKEVCASEELMTACDVQAWPQGDGASCGCVNKQCIWYR